MPNASAPNAPCVEVWLSPQTIVMPGWVRPSCGPITCTMPWSRSPIGASRMPNSAAFFRSASIWARLTGSADRATSGAETVEGLRARDLVHEVQVDVEQVRLAGGAAHHVGLVDLLR